MKKRKPANFDYDFTGLEVEVTGDDLYLINGGAQIENTIVAQANAKPGDTVVNSKGEEHTIWQGDIDWAQEQLGPELTTALTTSLENQMGAMHNPATENPKTDFSKFSTAQEALQALGYKTEPSSTPSLTNKEINKIMQRNPDAYASSDELLAEWEEANSLARKNDSPNLSGIGFGFKSIDSAAMYWAKTYGDDSIVTGHEYTSVIFACDSVVKQEDGTTKNETRYFYNKPNEGYEKWEDGLLKKYCNIPWNQACYPAGNGIENFRVVSAIHSHGDDLYGEYQSSSDTDKDGVDKAKEYFSYHTGSEYVVLPNGWVEEFKGKDDYQTSIISKDCYSDIRGQMPYSFIESEFGMEIFNLYKNAYYHPDEFVPYSEN